MTRGASPIFRPDAPPQRRDGEWRVYRYVNLLAGAEQQKSRRVDYVKLAVRNRHQCRGAAGGASCIFLLDATKENHLVNHSFRLDSQRLLSYQIHMRVLTLAVTPTAHTQQRFKTRSIQYRLSHRRKSIIDCAEGDIAP